MVISATDVQFVEFEIPLEAVLEQADDVESSAKRMVEFNQSRDESEDDASDDKEE